MSAFAIMRQDLVRPNSVSLRSSLLLCALVACDKPAAPPAALDPPVSTPVPTASTPPKTPESPTVHVESVPVPGDAPVFVLRGGRGNRRMVFLHGHCSHALGYLQSFQHAAAKHGTILAVQADKPCGDGPFREWTNTAEALDTRVVAAFRASGDETDVEGLVIMGYSSGAVLAEMLAHKFPTRYSHVVLLGGPQKPVEWRLRKTRSTVMIAGERDRQDLMQSGARELRAAGIPSTFLILPGAKHGQMGPEAERVMTKAFDWLWANERTL